MPEQIPPGLDPNLIPINSEVQSGPPQDLSLTNPAPKKSSKARFFIVLAVVIFLLGGLGYFVYAKYSPQAVAAGFISQVGKSSTGSKHFDFSVKYSDIQNSKANLDFQGDWNNKGPAPEQNTFDSKVQLDLNFQLQPSSGLSASQPLNFNFNNLDIKFVNDVLYLNVSEIPELSSAVQNYGGWVKLDLNSLPKANQDQINSLFKQDSTSSTGGNSQKFLADLNKYNAVSYHFLGTQKVDGILCYHYQLQLNKDTLAQFFADTLSQESVGSSANEQSILSTFKTVFNQLTFKDVEAWIGISNRELHRYTADIGAPEISALTSGGASNSVDFLINYDVFDIPDFIVSTPPNALDLKPYLTAKNQLP